MTTQLTCKTCRWWGDSKPYPFGRCHHKHLEVADHTAFVPIPSHSGLLVRADGHDHGIYTGPDFGCIHHERRMKADDPDHEAKP